MTPPPGTLVLVESPEVWFASNALGDLLLMSIMRQQWGTSLPNSGYRRPWLLSCLHSLCSSRVLALMTQASGRGLRRKDLTVASCRLCLRSQALSPRVLEELSSAKSHLREFGGRSVPSGVFRWDHGPRQHLHWSPVRHSDTEDPVRLCPDSWCTETVK